MEELYKFDLIAYLQDKGIEYSEDGKNTTSGWTEVNCPFCGDDPSMHLGISPERLLNCWRCGAKGSVLKYIRAIENCSWAQAKKVTSNYVDDSLQHLKTDIMERSTREGKGTILPEGIENLSEIHYQYLEERGYDPIYIERKYKLKALGRALKHEDRKFQFRLIIPIIQNNIVVNFTARDFAGTRIPKYINQSNENAIVPMKNCVYNIDSVRDTVLVLEGVTDVWRMGDGSVAMMGVEFTTKQLNLLLQKKPKRAFVMFDAEEQAQKRANKIANVLSGFAKTEILELKNGDPGELTQEEADEIAHDIGLK